MVEGRVRCVWEQFVGDNRGCCVRDRHRRSETGRSNFLLARGREGREGREKRGEVGGLERGEE